MHRCPARLSGAPHRRAASWLVAAGLFAGGQLPASAQAPLADAATLLARHVASVGGEERLRGVGDVEFLGELSSSSSRLRYRLLVRRAPFAVREEYSSLDDPAQRAVSVCNGARAWDLEAPPGARNVPGRPTSPPLHVEPGEPGVPMPRTHGLAMLERACAAQLLTQPWAARWTGRPALAGDLVDVPLEDGVPAVEAGVLAGGPVSIVTLRTGPGTELAALFDVRDGRLRATRSDEEALGNTWLRFDDWRETEGLTWPMRWVVGSGLQALNVVTLTEVRTHLALDDALFAGDPQVREGSVQDATSLRVVPTTLPGSGYIVLDGVRLAGSTHRAILDTGADRIYVEEDVGRRSHLASLGDSFANSSTGLARVERGWIDALGLGTVELVQRQCSTFRGGMPELFPADQPWLILGATELHEDTPVLDLRAAGCCCASRP